MISFIIVNRNGKDLDKAIDNIQKVYNDYEKEIIVVQQEDDEPFKRGQLFNIGVSFSNGEYIALSDNDMFHLRKVNWIDIYETYKKPIVGFKYITQVDYNNGNVKQLRTDLCTAGFGGFNFMKKNDFIEANGFSNLYMGWGAEDAEFFERFNDYIRLPQNLGHLIHPSRADANNYHTKVNRDIYYHHKHNKLDDGLKQTRFNLVEKVEKNNCIFIKVNNINVDENFAYKELLNKHFIK